MVEKTEEIEKLKKEIRVLRETITDLRETLDDIKATVVTDTKHEATSSYKIFPNSDNCLDIDASWLRLMNLLEKTNNGLSAAQAAKRWGKSRSRTSEVLNKLADDGHLVKYRDGREIKFRAAEE